MPAGSADFVIEQGATFNRTITWKDANGDLVNLTGYTARMQLRTTVLSGTVTLDMTTANGKITLGGAAGTIELAIDATATAALGAGTYVYDLELVNGAEVTRLLKGNVTVDPEVTR